MNPAASQPEEQALPEGQNPSSPADLTPPQGSDEPVPVQLGARPLETLDLNNTAKLSVELGVNSDQLAATTSTLNQNFANAMRAVLNGNTSGVDLNLIASIDAERSKQRIMLKTLKGYFLHMLDAARPHSKELKALAKATKKAKSLMDLVTTLANYSESNSDFDLVTEIFANSMSLLLYGQGSLQSDSIKKYLRQVTISDNGEAKPLKGYLDALIGEPASLFDAQNSNREEALAARITSDVMLQSPMIAGLDIAEVLRNMAKNRPPSQEGMTKQDTDGLAGINAFIESIKTSSAELRQVGAKDMLQEARKKRSKDASDKAELALGVSKEDQQKITGEVQSLQSNIQDLENKERNMRSSSASDKDVKLEELSNSIKFAKTKLATQNELLSSKNREIEGLIAKVNSTAAELSKYEEEAFATKESAVLKADEILASLEQVVSFINFKVQSMKEAGKDLDMSAYATLMELMNLFADNASDNKAVLGDKLMTFLTESTKLGLVRDLTNIQFSLTDTRNYTLEEYSLTLLTEFYQKQSPDITRDTAKLMAASHYVRMQKEIRLQEFRNKLINQRGSESLKGVEKVDAAKLIKLVAKERTGVLKDPSLSVEGSINPAPSELAVLEGLSPDMSLGQLRQYLSENPASIDSLTFMMYNLVSYYIPRNLADGQRMVLKNEKEIAKIEVLVSNLLKFISENAALNILDQAKKSAQNNGGNSESMNLVVALKAYSDEHEAREQEIVLAARAKKSKTLSQATFKKLRKQLLAQAKEEGWSKEELHEQVKNAGLDGIGDKGISARYYKNWVLGGAAVPFKYIYEGSGKIVKKAGSTVWNYKGKALKVVTAPIWVGPWALYQVGKNLGKATKYVIMNPGKSVAGVVATAGALVTLPIGIPVGIAKAAKEGVLTGANAMKQRGEKTINDVKEAMNKAVLKGKFPWSKKKDEDTNNQAEAA